MRPGLLLALAAAAGAGCGRSGLQGSLGEDVSLDFSTVLLQRTPTAVALVYQRPVPGQSGNDIVLKVTASTQGLNLDGGGLAIDLAEVVGGAPRGSVVRVVSGDGRSQLPPVQRGTLTFDQAPVAGATVTGSFNVLFAPGVAFGSGKTVFGDFSATVTVPSP